MKFERTYKVGVREIGRSNKITNLGLLGFLEEIASLHSATLGFGINDVEKNHKVWILMDWKLQVIDRPKYEDELTIKTWGKPFLKPRFYTYRDFQIFNQENKLVAIASSKWVYFDIEKNKISKLDLDMIAKYNPEDENVFDEEDIPKLNCVLSKENADYIYTVKRADIDVNQHMHNLNYLSLAYEALPEEIYNNQELTNVRITYKKQIMLGETVKCYYYNENGVHTIEIKSNDEKVLHSIIQLS